MHEYVNVSVSSYDPSALAQKLTERSADGWEVVGIVPTGSDITAFLRREMAAGAAMATSAAAAAPSPAPSPEPEPISAPTPEPASEPAGWAVAPEPTPASSSPATVIAGANAEVSPTPSGGYDQGAGGYTGGGYQGGGYQAGGYQGGTGGYQQQATPAAQPAAQPAAAQASTPAGWYHDPSGRYELRYWDGSQWTEHVARGGQQYTDPPVA